MMCFRMRHLCWSVPFVAVSITAWISSPASVWAQLPATQLTSVFPPGAKAGSSVQVKTGGADQEESTQLLFSHPGIKAAVAMTAATEFEKARPQPGVFDVQIAGDVSAGVYEARVVGRFGISNPRAFVIGNYDETIDAGGNGQPANAKKLTVNSTMNGTVDSNQFDYFTLTLKSGQRVVIDCWAKRIDSRLRGTLILYDPSGKELVRDRGSANDDPLLDFTAAHDGEYRVALYDFTYRGGAEYFYRLTAHSGPQIDFVFPPSGLAGSNNSYVLYGRNLPGGTPAEGVKLKGVALEKLSVNIPLPADDPKFRSLEIGDFVSSTGALLDGIAYRFEKSNPSPIHFARGPVAPETEPNNQPGQSQRVAFPCEVVGQFYPANDVDYFSFEAKKGEVYDIEVISHQLGLPTDPILTIWKMKKNDKGEEVAQDVTQVDDPSDRNNRIASEFDTSTDDPEYRLTADEDAVYRVMVRDQFGERRSDPRMVYRLAIHRGEPDFRLVALPQLLAAPANNNNTVPLGGVSVRKGGAAPIEVRVDRRYGFAGDVEATIEGLPPGATCPSVVIGANSRTGLLIVSATQDAAAWAGTIRVQGKAKVGDRELVRAARAGVAVWNTANRQQELVPYRVTRDLAFAVVDRESQPALVQAAEDKVWETSRGGKLDVPIKVTRRSDFKEDLTLAPINPPNELKPGNFTVKGADGEGKLQIAATNGNVKPGMYTFVLRSDTKLKYQRNPDAVAAAEKEQKEIDATVATLTEKSKQAVDAKVKAPSLVQEAMNAVKQAEQEKTTADSAITRAADDVQVVANALAATREASAKEGGNKALADAVAIVEKAKSAAEAAKTAAEQRAAEAIKKIEQAQAAVQTAQANVPATEKVATEAEAKMKSAQAAKATVDKRLTDAKSANQPKDVQFALVSTPIKVRIVDSCLEMTLAGPTAAVKAGEKLELAVKINRLYGYDDAVEVTLDIPSDAKGLSANKLTLAKGQAEGKLEIAAANDAAAGERALTVKAKGRFNNIEVTTSQPLKLKVDGK